MKYTDRQTTSYRDRYEQTERQQDRQIDKLPAIEIRDEQTEIQQDKQIDRQTTSYRYKR